MTDKELREWDRLSDLWATGKATKAQMLRCLQLDRKAEKAAQS